MSPHLNLQSSVCSLGAREPSERALSSSMKTLQVVAPYVGAGVCQGGVNWWLTMRVNPELSGSLLGSSTCLAAALRAGALSPWKVCRIGLFTVTMGSLHQLRIYGGADGGRGAGEELAEVELNPTADRDSSAPRKSPSLFTA